MKEKKSKNKKFCQPEIRNFLSDSVNNNFKYTQTLNNNLNCWMFACVANNIVGAESFWKNG